MGLEDLGFDGWFQERCGDDSAASDRPFRVIVVHRNSYIVSKGDADVYAELAGKLSNNAASALDFPATGDWVLAQLLNDGTLAIIHSILPRKSLLARKTAGKKTELQLIAANVDTALIIQALDADFNLRRLERYLVMAADGNIDPVVLLSKSDLIDADEIEAKKQAVAELMPDLPVLAFSNESKSGLDAVKALFITGKTYCLLGSSGVGKTTLLNQMTDKIHHDTQEVRRDGKGRHTTTDRQLTVLPGGAMVVDTPGMRELGNIVVEKGLEDTFAEIAAAATGCRFNDCTHIQEDGCAVLAAVRDGTIDEVRYQSYLKLQRESAFNEMTYLEKRRKDKAFGKMIKSVMKDKRKRDR
jgi:ribosome biogenesis GTPase